AHWNPDHLRAELGNPTRKLAPRLTRAGKDAPWRNRDRGKWRLAVALERDRRGQRLFGSSELLLSGGERGCRAGDRGRRGHDDDLARHPFAVKQTHEPVGARRSRAREMHSELLPRIEPAAVVEALCPIERRLGDLRAGGFYRRGASRDKTRVRHGLNRI